MENQSTLNDYKSFKKYYNTFVMHPFSQSILQRRLYSFLLYLNSINFKTHILLSCHTTSNESCSCHEHVGFQLAWVVRLFIRECCRRVGATLCTIIFGNYQNYKSNESNARQVTEKRKRLLSWNLKGIHFRIVKFRLLNAKTQTRSKAIMVSYF